MKRGWTKKERKELMRTVVEKKSNGLPIRCAFEEFAKKSARKPDSVRNYYYACLAAADFYPEGITKKEVNVFTQKEAERLVCDILRLCAQGSSVKGAISRLTGDSKKRLRYQNKFRSLVKAKSPIVFAAMEKQKESSLYYNPFTKKVVEIEKSIKTLVSSDFPTKLEVAEYLSMLEKEAADRRDLAEMH